jgi:hypothetical protein
VGQAVLLKNVVGVGSSLAGARLGSRQVAALSFITRVTLPSRERLLKLSWNR